jgi:hypothetical protein
MGDLDIVNIEYHDDVITISTAYGNRFFSDSMFLINTWRDSFNVTMKITKADSIKSQDIYTQAMTTLTFFLLHILHIEHYTAFKLASKHNLRRYIILKFSKLCDFTRLFYVY